MSKTTYAGRMTHTHALNKLLEHGPLTAGELLEVTRWTRKNADQACQRLMKRGLVQSINIKGKRYYALASLITADGSQPSTANMPSGHFANTAPNWIG